MKNEKDRRLGASQGHRLLPHTADLIIEAWGPTRASCLDEAVMALVESFADVSGGSAAPRVVPVDIEGGDLEDLVALLLEEVIYIVEVLGVVPVSVELSEGENTRVAGFLETVPVTSVELIGAAPKAVSHHDLVLERRDDSWWCRAMIDV